MVCGSATGCAEHYRRRALGLEPEHPRGSFDRAVGRVLRVAHPVRRDVPGVPDRDAVDVGSPAERVAHLERAGLLALEPERVHGVHQRHRVPLGEAAGHVRASSKFPSTSSTRAPWTSVWASLPTATLPSRNEHRAGQPGLRRVGGGRRAGVPGRRAHDRLRALLDGLGDRERHAAVLERTRRVGALELQLDVAAGLVRQRTRSGRAACRPRRRVTTGVESVTGRRSRYSSTTPRHWCGPEPPGGTLTPRPPPAGGSPPPARSRDRAARPPSSGRRPPAPGA